MKWLLITVLFLPGCGAPLYPYSCGNPQVSPGTYSVARVQESLGTLVVRVIEQDGKPVPGTWVRVIREFTGSGPRPQCSGGLSEKTDLDGTIRLERMKPGLYSIQASDDAGNSVVQVTVHPDQTAEVTLTKR